jgi:phosphatidylglycerol---prolipoprotein diacylglyceryl transferase
MYGVALAASATVAVATSGVPFFHCNELVNIGIPIQAFGVIVAAGVLIGASLLRRYAEWHGVSDEHIRGITGWITIAGFAGAHIFDVLAYQYDKFEKDPILFFKVWDGISSYGGFLGGAIGFALYVWWKRLPVRLFADISIVGLLPAFSIGRIGCTVVSDHVGGMADPSSWYSFLAMEYPTNPKEFNNEVIQQLVRNETYAGHKVGETMLAWNLGLIEFLYLVPVNIIVLWLAFRSSKRVNAGFVTVLTGMLYAPVRFFLDFLRPENSDPRHLGLTFAQWASLLAFGVAAYAASKIFRDGAPAETVTKTSREAQERLKVILKDDEEREKEREEKEEPKKKRAVSEDERDRDDDDDDKDDDAEEKDVESTDKEDASDDKDDDADDKAPAKSDDSDSDGDQSDDEDVDDEDEKPAPAKPAPSANKPKQGGNKNKKKNKKKRR